MSKAFMEHDARFGKGRIPLKRFAVASAACASALALHAAFVRTDITACGDPEILAAPTAAELSDWQELRATYAPRGGGTVAEPTVAAWEYKVTNTYALVRDESGAVSSTNDPPNLLSFATDMQSLAGVWLKAETEDESPLRVRLEGAYFLMQDYLFALGLTADGAGEWLNWYSGREYVNACCKMAEPLQNSGRLQDVIDYLDMVWRYSNVTNWTATGTRGCDYFYIDVNAYLQINLMQPTNRVPWMRAYARRLNLDIAESFYPDGVVYHHGGMHFSYQAYMLPTFVNVLRSLCDTTNRRFAITETSYRKVRDSVMGQIHFCNQTQTPIAFQGRSPGTLALGTGGFSGLAALSRGYNGGAYDREVVNACLRFTPSASNTYASVNPVPDSTFTTNWAGNFGTFMGHRRDDWLAVVKGSTTFNWGTEIYAADGGLANNYGLFFGFGSLTVLAGGTPINLADSGINVDSGIDWSHFDGGTAYSPTPYVSRNTDYCNSSAFCGGVSHRGRDGAFAYDMAYPNISAIIPGEPSLWAKKTYFFFDDRIVMLGSGITLSSTARTLHTTLFQKTLATSDTPDVEDGVAITAFGITNTLAAGPAHTLIDTQGTGYYIATNNAPVIVRRQSQTSRAGSSTNMYSGDYVTAFLLHASGSSVTGAYEYAQLIRTTPDKLEAFRDAMAGGRPLYRVYRKDAAAHIVYDAPTRTCGWALFGANSSVTNGCTPFLAGDWRHPLRAADKGCAVMMTRDPEGRVDLSAFNPNVAFGVHAATNVLTLTLDGAYAAATQPGLALMAGSSQTAVALGFPDKQSRGFVLQSLDFTPYASRQDGAWAEGSTWSGYGAPSATLNALAVLVSNRVAGADALTFHDRSYISLAAGGSLGCTSVAVSASAGQPQALFFRGGTLLSEGDGAIPAGDLFDVRADGANAVFDTAGHTLTVDALVRDGAAAGGVTKTGAGTLTLNAANTYSGGTVVEDGTLVAGTASAFGSGALTVLAGKVSLGTNVVSVSSASFADGTTLAVTGGCLAVTGDLSVGGTVTLDAGDSSGWAEGYATLLTAGGHWTADAFALVGGLPEGSALMRSGSRLVLVTLGATSEDRVWVGASATADGWSDAANWDVPPENGDSLTFSGAARTANVNDALVVVRNVTFTNAAWNIGGDAVNLTGDMAANWTNTMEWGVDTTLDTARTFSVQSGNGSLVLSGAVSGCGGVTKTGFGALTLSGANTFSGPVTVSAGTLAFSTASDVGGGASALGAPTNAAAGVIGLSGGTALKLASAPSDQSTDRAVRLSGASGNYTIQNATSRKLTLTADFLSDATGTGTRSLYLTPGSGGIELQGAVGDLGSGLVTKLETTGANWAGYVLRLSATNSTYSGLTTVGNGTVIEAARLALTGEPSSIGTGLNDSRITFAYSTSGGNYGTLRYVGTEDAVCDRPLFFNGYTSAPRTLANNSPNNAPLTLSGTLSGSLAYASTAPIQLHGTSTATNTLAGRILDPSTGAAKRFSVVVDVSGAWALTAANNAYSGGTTVNGGLLLANSTEGSATGSGDVVVTAGGTLGGTGAVAGAVSVAVGGTLEPGAGGEGVLTLASNLTFTAGSTNRLRGCAFTRVGGDVALSGSALAIDISEETFAAQSVFWIVDKTSAGPVSGALANLSEGTGAGVFGGRTYYITYCADFEQGRLSGGNDVALYAASARTSVWNGDGAASVWSEAENWDEAPINGANLVFSGVSRTANTNDAFVSVGSVTFRDAAWEICGNAVTISGNMTNAAPETVVWGLDSALDGVRAFNAVSNGVIVLGGVMSGAGGVAKTGDGTLALNGENTYAGGTVVTAGALEAGGASAFGNGALTVLAGRVSLGTNAVAVTAASFADGTTLALPGGRLTVAGALAVAGTVTLELGDLVGFPEGIAVLVAAGGGDWTAASFATASPLPAGFALARSGGNLLLVRSNATVDDVVWTGVSGGSSDWSDAANWSAPAGNGDKLTFGSTLRTANTNNLLSSVGLLTFTNAAWTVSGDLTHQSLTTTAGIVAYNNATMNLSLVLSASQTFKVPVNGKTLTINGDVDSNGKTLTIQGYDPYNAGTVTINGNVSGGTGGGTTISKGNGDGSTLNLNGGANRFLGAVNWGRGTLNVKSLSSEGGFIGAGSTTSYGNSINYTGTGGLVTARALRPNNSGSGYTAQMVFNNNSVSSSLSFTNRSALTLGYRNLNLGGTSTGTNLLAASYSSSSSVGIIVSGSTWVLGGTNAYSGATSVNAGGTLLVTGALAGTHAVTVASRGKLGGTGTVVGAVNVAAGGVLEAGVNGAGSLSLSSNLTFAAASTNRVSSSRGLLRVGGAVALNDATLALDIPVGEWTRSATLWVLDKTSDGPVSGTFNGLCEGAVIGQYGGRTFRITYQADYSRRQWAGGNDVAMFTCDGTILQLR